jgi:hypothetical protein
MNTNESFEVAGGSVPGHARSAAKANQDAFYWAADAEGLVAVVCDGCGSRPHSGVGSQLGARLVVQATARLLHSRLGVCDLLERVRQDVLASLSSLAESMSADASANQDSAASFGRTVADHFLFTIVGVLITPHAATTFSLGDGIVIINGEVNQLGPFPNNEPPYLGYSLLPGATDCSGGDRPPFAIHRSMPVSDVQSLVLGTDGAGELAAVAPLSPFWSDDRFFKNPDMVRRRLAVLNRGPRGGLLADDTTLVVIRRKAAEG